MKIKFYSVLVSIFFIPVAVLSQWIGLYIGKVLYFIYDKIMGLRLPDFIIDTGPTIVSGLIAGYISALAVTKIYKNYDIIFVVILPSIIILLAIIGDISLAAEAEPAILSVLLTAPPIVIPPIVYDAENPEDS